MDGGEIWAYGGWKAPIEKKKKNESGGTLNSKAVIRNIFFRQENEKQSKISEAKKKNLKTRKNYIYILDLDRKY